MHRSVEFRLPYTQRVKVVERDGAGRHSPGTHIG